MPKQLNTVSSFEVWYIWHFSVMTNTYDVNYIIDTVLVVLNMYVQNSVKCEIHLAFVIYVNTTTGLYYMDLYYYRLLSCYLV